jgi:hypothetical protein
MKIIWLQIDANDNCWYLEIIDNKFKHESPALKKYIIMKKTWLARNHNLIDHSSFICETHDNHLLNELFDNSWM